MPQLTGKEVIDLAWIAGLVIIALGVCWADKNKGDE